MAWKIPDVVNGRIAEELVHELFKELKFEVYPYGYEQTVTGLTYSLKNIKPSKRSKVQSKIANMPDFVVHHEKKGTFFIEVKYRSKGKLTKKDAEGYDEDTLFVLCSPKLILCSSQQELVGGVELSTESYSSGQLLGDREEFNFDLDERRKIREYCKYIIDIIGTKS
jgi:hypothetical protein